MSRVRNVTIEYRWAGGDYDRLHELAEDLVRRQVTVIAATGGAVSARAAKAATTTIPVLFIGGADPVGAGLVSSFNRPGGNVTGVSTYTSELGPKRLELLRELVPKATKIAMLVNSENIADRQDVQDMEAAMQVAGVPLLTLRARIETEFEPAFVSASQQGAHALLVSSDAFFNSRRAQLVALAARYAVPAAYAWSEYAKAGGLMSYGTSLPGGVPPDRSVRHPHPQGGASQPNCLCRISDQIRPAHQPQDRQGARPRSAADAARARRRGDRIVTLFCCNAYAPSWHSTAMPTASNMSGVEGRPAAPSRCRDFSSLTDPV